MPTKAQGHFITNMNLFLKAYNQAHPENKPVSLLSEGGVCNGLTLRYAQYKNDGNGDFSSMIQIVNESPLVSRNEEDEVVFNYNGMTENEMDQWLKYAETTTLLQESKYDNVVQLNLPKIGLEAETSLASVATKPRDLQKLMQDIPNGYCAFIYSGGHIFCVVKVEVWSAKQNKLIPRYNLFDSNSPYGELSYDDDLLQQAHADVAANDEKIKNMENALKADITQEEKDHLNKELTTLLKEKLNLVRIAGANANTEQRICGDVFHILRKLEAYQVRDNAPTTDSSQKVNLRDLCPPGTIIPFGVVYVPLPGLLSDHARKLHADGVAEVQSVMDSLSQWLKSNRELQKENPFLFAKVNFYLNAYYKGNLSNVIILKALHDILNEVRSEEMLVGFFEVSNKYREDKKSFNTHLEEIQSQRNAAVERKNAFYGFDIGRIADSSPGGTSFLRMVLEKQDFDAVAELLRLTAEHHHKTEKETLMNWQCNDIPVILLIAFFGNVYMLEKLLEKYDFSSDETARWLNTRCSMSSADAIDTPLKFALGNGQYDIANYMLAQVGVEPVVYSQGVRETVATYLINLAVKNNDVRIISQYPDFVKLNLTTKNSNGESPNDIINRINNPMPPKGSELYRITNFVTGAVSKYRGANPSAQPVASTHELELGKREKAKLRVEAVKIKVKDKAQAFETTLKEKKASFATKFTTSGKKRDNDENNNPPSTSGPSSRPGSG